MINGIEILNQTEIIETIYRIPEWLHITGVVVIIIGLLILGLFLSDKLESGTIAAFIVVFIGIFIIIGWCKITTYKQATGTYEYQVTISDDISFKEFDNKYEVIKQEGKIYTILEKD